MLCYLNRGLILEQAIAALIHSYFGALNLESKYKNFRVNVTTEHPFAKLYLYDGLSASDSFPAVVVTTQEDAKPAEFDGLAPHSQMVDLTADDIREITKGGLPGLCTVVDEATLDAIHDAIKKHGRIRGHSIRARRRDSMSIEIWAENIQLKNEIYEQTRLFVAGSLRHLLAGLYPFFDTAIFDGTVTGRRSNNFNFDFDVLLAGAHIGFDVNYCVEQIAIDTEEAHISKEIILRGRNHVRREENRA